MNLGHAREKAFGLARQHGRAALAYVAAFGASKALVVFGPILLAKLYAPDVYGAIELALSTSMFLATLMSGAVTSAVPRLHLSRSPVIIDDVIAATVACAGIILLTLALGLFAATGRQSATLCLLATVPAMVQGALSVHFLAARKRSLAALSSASATITATATAAALLLLPAVKLSGLLLMYALIGAVLVALAARLALSRRLPDFQARARKAVTVGLPILAYGLVASWIAASGRVYIAGFLSVETVAVYSFAFRIAAMALLPYALITSGLFAQVYRMRTRRFDRLAPIYLGLTALFGLVLTLAFPRLLLLLAPKALSPETRLLATSVFALVMGQVIGWAVSASIFLRINRTGLAGKAAIATALVAAAIGAAFLIMARTGHLSLPVAALLLLVQEFAQIAMLIALLWRKGLPLPRIAVFSVVLAAASIGLYLIGVPVPG